VLGRVAVLAVCVVAVAVLTGRRADDGACRDARARAFALAGRGVQSAAGGAALAPALRANCHDADELAGGAASLLVAGRRADALALAREATRRAPDVFAGWVALEAALRRADPAGARRAEARARALNPRWTGPAPLPAPRASAGP
jgi:Flp pilus assembly protein TadD